jgi:hypothetical protein
MLTYGEPQSRQAILGAVSVRIKRQHMTEVCDRAGFVALLLVDDAAVDGGYDVFRIKLDRPVVIGDGAIVVALDAVGFAAVE